MIRCNFMDHEISRYRPALRSVDNAHRRVLLMTWKHFPICWSLCEGNHPVTGGFPSQKARSADRCVSFCLPKQIVEHTIELVIWDAVTFGWRYCNVQWSFVQDPARAHCRVGTAPGLPPSGTAWHTAALPRQLRHGSAARLSDPT